MEEKTRAIQFVDRNGIVRTGIEHYEEDFEGNEYHLWLNYAPPADPGVMKRVRRLGIKSPFIVLDNGEIYEC